MKKHTLKIFTVAISLTVLNIPLFFISQTNYISHEQLDFPANSENNLNVSEEDFIPKKQFLTAQEDNLSGISLLIFNDDLVGTKNVRLRIYSIDNLTETIINKNYEIRPDYNRERLTFEFNKVIKLSKNKKFLVVTTPKKYSKEALTKFLSDKENLLNIQPVYETNNILKDIYYRTSQYKPFIMKNPYLIILYILFNILFTAIVLEFSKSSRKDQKDIMDQRKSQ